MNCMNCSLSLMLCYCLMYIHLNSISVVINQQLGQACNKLIQLCLYPLCHYNFCDTIKDRLIDVCMYVCTAYNVQQLFVSVFLTWYWSSIESCDSAIVESVINSGQEAEKNRIISPATVRRCVTGVAKIRLSWRRRMPPSWTRHRRAPASSTSYNDVRQSREAPSDDR